MNLDQEQIELLIMDSALDSFKLHVARCKRIADRAVADYREASDVMEKMAYSLDTRRKEYLRSKVV